MDGVNEDWPVRLPGLIFLNGKKQTGLGSSARASSTVPGNTLWSISSLKQSREESTIPLLLRGSEKRSNLHKVPQGGAEPITLNPTHHSVPPLRRG